MFVVTFFTVNYIAWYLFSICVACSLRLRLCSYGMLNSPLQRCCPLSVHRAHVTHSACRGALTRAQTLHWTLHVCRSSLKHTCICAPVLLFTQTMLNLISFRFQSVKYPRIKLRSAVFWFFIHSRARTCADERRRTDHFRVRAGAARWLDERKRGHVFASPEALSLNGRSSDWTDEAATSHVTLSTSYRCHQKHGIT